MRNNHGRKESALFQFCLPTTEPEFPNGLEASVRPSLVAGIAGLKSTENAPKNPSANLLRDWIEGDTFVWLVSDEILL